MLNVYFFVSHGFDGFGDFSFSIKTITYLKQLWGDEHNFTIVSQPRGIKELNTILPNQSTINFLPLETFAKQLSDKAINIDLFIEGPVFHPGAHSAYRGNQAMIPLLPPKTKVLLMTEYCYDNAFSPKQVMNVLKPNPIMLMQMGLEPSAHEVGIYISDKLLSYAKQQIEGHIELPSHYLFKLPAPLHTQLTDLGIDGTDTELDMGDIELTMEYSHRYCKRFFQIHGQYAATREQHFVVVAVGKETTKKEQFIQEISPLKENFKSITWLDLDSNTTTEIYTNPSSSVTRKYTVIHCQQLSLFQMHALQLLSGPIVGCTGDQSLGETLSMAHIPVYECLPHKKLLAISLANRLRESELTIDPLELTIGVLRSQSALSAELISVLSNDDALFSLRRALLSIAERFNWKANHTTDLMQFKKILEKASISETHDSPTPAI